MSDFKNNISDHLQQFPTNPYLFVGSGLSRRYLNLPTWLDLLDNFSSTLSLPKQFEYYQSTSNGNLPKLASILAKEFHENWWGLKQFETSRNKNKDEARKGINLPFKIEISDYVIKNSKINKDYKEEIELLKKAVIDGIITTNWDTFLNEAFSEFKPYIGQQELMFSDSFSIGELYKIHGCSTNPNSIIVTEEDYENFNSKNAYLAAKLLTIFVEHPIIFIGYSISDKNITEILNSIVSCVDNANIDKLKNRLIFVEWVPEKIKSSVGDGNIVLSDKCVLPIKHIKLHDFSELFEILASLKKRLPIKVLRNFKDAVYNLVKTNTPSKTIYIGDLSNIKDDHDVEFVIGVGVASAFSEQGYKAIQAIDLIEDVILDNKNYDSNKLVQQTIPEMLKGKVYLPIYKYLRKINLLDNKASLISNHGQSQKIVDIIKGNKIENYFPAENYAKKKNEIRKKYSSVNEIVKGEDTIHALYYIPLLDKTNIDLSELKKFLSKCFKDASLNKNTQFKKIVCLYDFLKYGLK